MPDAEVETDSVACAEAQDGALADSKADAGPGDDKLKSEARDTGHETKDGGFDADESKSDDPSEWKESKEADVDAIGEMSSPNSCVTTPATAAAVDAAIDRAHAACTAEGDSRQVQNEPFDDAWLRQTAAQWALHVRSMAMDASAASISVVTSPSSLTTTMESATSTMAYTAMTSPDRLAQRTRVALKSSQRTQDRQYVSVFDRLSDPEHFIGAERAKHEAKLRSMLISPGTCTLLICTQARTFYLSLVVANLVFNFRPRCLAHSQ